MHHAALRKWWMTGRAFPLSRGFYALLTGVCCIGYGCALVFPSPVIYSSGAALFFDAADVCSVSKYYIDFIKLVLR
jgi:hypothetical protein